MASRLNPYISFRDTARPAMELYQSVFGGDLSLSTFGEFGAEGAAHADQIMHGRLDTVSGYTIMAADTHPAWTGQERGSNITVSLTGDDDADLRGYWEKLADGGTVMVPAREADVGRRVRHVHGPVRHRLDGQHQSAAELTSACRGGQSPAAARRPAPTRLRGHPSAAQEDRSTALVPLELDDSRDDEQNGKNKPPQQPAIHAAQHPPPGSGEITPHG